MIKLDDAADEIEWRLESGEDPANTVTEVVDELKVFLAAIDDDPGQFSTQDVS